MAKAKKTKRTKLRSTDWQVGMPLVFPTSAAEAGIKRLAREAAVEGIKGPFRRNQKKRKKS
jgi:hypothetical protein